jgi:hypothetical protein
VISEKCDLLATWWWRTLINDLGVQQEHEAALTGSRGL